MRAVSACIIFLLMASMTVYAEPVKEPVRLETQSNLPGEVFEVDGHPAFVLLPTGENLMHYNWAVEHPDSVAGIAGIYPVCNIQSWPGLEKASGAYGLTVEKMTKQLAKHNPLERLAPLAAAKVPLLHVHGDADTLIKLDEHSEELADRLVGDAKLPREQRVTRITQKAPIQGPHESGLLGPVQLRRIIQKP